MSAPAAGIVAINAAVGAANADRRAHHGGASDDDAGAFFGLLMLVVVIVGIVAVIRGAR